MKKRNIKLPKRKAGGSTASPAVASTASLPKTTVPQTAPPPCYLQPQADSYLALLSGAHYDKNVLAQMDIMKVPMKGEAYWMPFVEQVMKLTELADLVNERDVPVIQPTIVSSEPKALVTGICYDMSNAWMKILKNALRNVTMQSTLELHDTDMNTYLTTLEETEDVLRLSSALAKAQQVMTKEYPWSVVEGFTSGDLAKLLLRAVNRMFTIRMYMSTYGLSNATAYIQTLQDQNGNGFFTEILMSFMEVSLLRAHESGEL